jgi:N-acetylglucosamine malate deacetylase 1
MKNVLTIAAHPDDDVLGCGGTMAKLSDHGVTVHVAFIADGISSRSDGEFIDSTKLKARREAAEAACAILGVNSPTFKDLPDNQMDTVPLLEVAKMVESLIDEYQPDTIFTHHSGDLNIDHRRVHQAVVTACRPQTNHPVRTLLFFEIPSSTEWQIQTSASAFLPNWYEEITTSLDRKLRALNAYSMELKAWPHPRSPEGVDALARWRGATVGVSSAEAFMLGRRRG